MRTSPINAQDLGSRRSEYGRRGTEAENLKGKKYSLRQRASLEAYQGVASPWPFDCALEYPDPNHALPMGPSSGYTGMGDRTSKLKKHFFMAALTLRLAFCLA